MSGRYKLIFRKEKKKKSRDVSQGLHPAGAFVTPKPLPWLWPILISFVH